MIMWLKVQEEVDCESVGQMKKCTVKVTSISDRDDRGILLIECNVGKLCLRVRKLSSTLFST